MFKRIKTIASNIYKKFAVVETRTNRRTGVYNNSSQERITDQKLINDFKRFAYACASINANACARIPFHLYVKTSNGDPKSRLKSSPVNNAKYAYITEKFNLNKGTLKNLEEVTEHPILSFLNKGNDSPLTNGYHQRLLTFFYLEITGASYWLLQKGIFNLPIESWVLPSQLVEPYREPYSRNLIDYYKFNGAEGEEKYPIDRIVQYLLPELNNPYLYGRSPHEASIEASAVSNKWISHETSFLDREARPDIVLSPKDKENTIGDDEADNWERRFINKFGRGRSGGVYVPNEAVDVNILNYPPKDLAGLKINEEAKFEIANAFLTPLAFLTDKTNKAVLEGALTQHALQLVDPRLKIIESVWNNRLLPLYDPTGRLFICFDNPVPEDREAKMQENVQLKANGCKTANEVRDEYGLPPHPDGDKLESQNVAGGGAIERDKKRFSGEAEK